MKGTINWSSGHTRLRYQSVLSALIFASIVDMGVKKAGIPGFFVFKESPDETILRIGTLLFALFSMVSFWMQDRLEYNTRHDTIKSCITLLQSNNNFYIDKVRVDKYVAEKLGEYLSKIDSHNFAKEEKAIWIKGNDLQIQTDSAKGAIKVFRMHMDSISKTLSSIDDLFPNEPAQIEMLKGSLEHQREMVESLNFDTEISSSALGDGYKRESIEHIRLFMNSLPRTYRFMIGLNDEVLDQLRNRSVLSKIQSRILPFWVPFMASFLFLAVGAWLWAM